MALVGDQPLVTQIVSAGAGGGLLMESSLNSYTTTGTSVTVNLSRITQVKRVWFAYVSAPLLADICFWDQDTGGVGYASTGTITIKRSSSGTSGLKVYVYVEGY